MRLHVPALHCVVVPHSGASGLVGKHVSLCIFDISNNNTNVNSNNHCNYK